MSDFLHRAGMQLSKAMTNGSMWSGTFTFDPILTPKEKDAKTSSRFGMNMHDLFSFTVEDRCWSKFDVG